MNDVLHKFDRIADGYSEHDYADPARYAARRAKLIVELGARLEPGASVLDLGCGDGIMAAPLTGYGLRYRGVDASEGMVAAARARNPGLPFDHGRSEEYVVAALLHDIGDELAPWTHGEMTAAILKPFIAPDICWIVKHHGLFQMYYYAHYSGGDRNARDRFQDHPCYDACIEFCERYDQNCFDPAYDSLPVELFEPMVRRVFAEPRYLPE